MKTSRTILAVAFLTAALISCDKEDTQVKPLNLPLKAGEVIKADNTFGFDLYQKLAVDAEPGTNVMISPLSVSQALAMTYNGANGATRIAMENALQTAGIDRDELNELNKTLVDALLSHDPKVILEIANSIWYRQEYDILQDFIKRNKDFYNADVRPMDFSAANCKDIINGWVDDKTHGKISEIVKEIKPESFMFLINAIYFKGTWTYEFAKKDTHTEPFYLEDGTTKQVNMMKQELDLNTLSNEWFNSVELPYGKGNWRMFLFLPAGDKKLAEIEGRFTQENWEQWLKSYQESKEVRLYLPRFTFAYEESLKKVLASMGMDVAFSDQADFTGILPGGGLLISDVKHKTFVEVNEEGTEAAAVTSVEIEFTSIGNYISFNRPFLFVIAERSTGAILFIGKLVNPESN